MIGLIHIVIGSFHVCYVDRGALRRLMHTEVCIGLDIAHFPSLMYGFIMQQTHLGPYPVHSACSYDSSLYAIIIMHVMRCILYYRENIIHMV